MPISPSPQPTIPAFPQAPNSSTQSPDEFDVTANTYVEAQVDYVPEQNALGVWQNSTAQEVYDNAVEASASATSASNSEVAAASSANFIGLWADLTGSVSIGEGVGHNSAQWRAVAAIADVTLSEPSPTNSDWMFVSGNTWLKLTASSDVIPNSKMQISATAAPVDIQLVPMIIGDSFTLRNNTNSTETVRLVNSSYTIIGYFGEVASTDNLIFPANSTRIFIVRDTNILEVL
jgi:hypothetical protein